MNAVPLIFAANLDKIKSNINMTHGPQNSEQ